MLVPTMNFSEIQNEVLKDLKFAKQAAIRFMPKYQRKLITQKKRKERYPIVIERKSPLKNKWLIEIENDPIQKGHILTTFTTYYYNDKGFRLFRVLPNDMTIAAYNGHFFSRYNERLNLELTHTTDIVKHYLKNNVLTSGQQVGKPIQDEVKEIIGHCTDGMLMGYIDENIQLITWNTFISQEEMKNSQLSDRDLAFEKMKEEYKNKMLNQNDFDWFGALEAKRHLLYFKRDL